MATFTDRLKREWSIELTLGAITRVRKATGLAIADTFSEKDGGSVLSQIVMDPFQLGAVLWVLCEEQAERLGVDEVAFADGFDAAAIDQAADALIRALVDFFLKGQKGEVFKRRLKSHLALLDRKTAAMFETELSDETVEAKIDETIASMRNEPPGKSPASPVSATPDPAHFAS